MFLCREHELQVLNRRYQSEACECVVVYGRRRVGKTALITEFAKDKKTILFPALKATARDNLEALSKAIAAYRAPGVSGAPVYRSFDDAFTEITHLAKDERVVFIIDELPFLCEADDSIPSRLQHLLDHEWKETKLYLILCGSSMSFMEKEILSEKSPLFGRRTAQLKVMPLSYVDAARFHPELSPEDNALIYGVTGGIPHYINLLQVKENVRDALIENFFDRSAYLFEEPENLLRQELREPAIYNSIITAIAEGGQQSKRNCVQGAFGKLSVQQISESFDGIGHRSENRAGHEQFQEKKHLPDHRSFLPFLVSVCAGKPDVHHGRTNGSGV